MKSGEFNVLKRLEKLLKDRGISRYELSRICGIPMSTISTWYGNDSFPGNAYLLKICKALDITIPEFFNCCDDIMITDPDAIEHMKLYFSLTGEQRELIDSSMKMLIHDLD